MHPDRFANASENERLLAVQYTSLVNDAYETLKSSLKRAAYLLSLQSIDVSHADQSDLGMDLLVQQMELREELEGIAEQESAIEKLEVLHRKVKEKLTAKEKLFATSIGDGNFDQGKKEFFELQFLFKLNSEIKAVEERLLGY